MKKENIGKITEIQLEEYKNYLIEQEKSKCTVEKYRRDIQKWMDFLDEREVTKELMVEYKKELGQQYAAASCNSMLVAVNVFLEYLGLGECRVKLFKVQKRVFSDEKKELSVKEYKKLIETAKKMHAVRLGLVIQTLGGTGMRVGELHFVTVQAVKEGRVEVEAKGKKRVVFIPRKLQILLRQYIKERQIKSGPVFVSKAGRMLDRSNIWKEMKALCQKAGVSKEKVFPHNLRHLFARVYYNAEKDIAKLADLLGHSSMETTRLYIISSGSEHRKQIEKMGLVFE